LTSSGNRNGASGRSCTCINSFRRRMPRLFGHGSGLNLVTCPGAAPGVSSSQARRVRWLPRTRICSGKTGGLCGHCSRDLPLDRRLLFVAELTGQYILKWCGVRVTLPVGSMNAGFTDRLASLANYRRMKWLRDVDSNHDVRAYETPLVPNLPASGKWWTAAALHRALSLARRVTS